MAASAESPHTLAAHPASDSARRAEPAPGQDDARARQQELGRRLASPPPRWGRAVKIGLGLGLAAAFGVAPALRLYAPASVEAVLDARLINLRAPIAGVVTRLGDEILLDNPEADAAPVEALGQQLARLDAARAGALARREALGAALAENEAAEVDFRKFRIAELDARLDELAARRKAAEWASQEAEARHLRAENRLAHGVGALADRDSQNRLAARAAAEAQAIAAQSRQVEVERDALRLGRYVGDNYNDRPSTAQKSDEDRQRLAELDAELAQNQFERVVVEMALARAREKLSAESARKLTPPAGAQPWARLVAVGERVERGQILARYADCAAPLVAAAVSEVTFNGLKLGQPARFERPGAESLTGKIIALSGQAADDPSLAIAPRDLNRAPFHVLVALPPGACAIGRTGRLAF